MSVEVALPGRAGRIEELYARHAADAGRLAFLLTGDRELAEDLAQEAFVRCIGRLGGIRDPGAFPGYLRRAVVNLTRKHWRRSASERRAMAREYSQRSTRADDPHDPTDRDKIWTALHPLPVEQRAAIVLRYVEDLSESDAAAALGCPKGTLKSRVSRGLQALRVEIGGRDEPD